MTEPYLAKLWGDVTDAGCEEPQAIADPALQYTYLKFSCGEQQQRTLRD